MAGGGVYPLIVVSPVTGAAGGNGNEIMLPTKEDLRSAGSSELDGLVV
jgi:hypothetical protein